MPRRKNDDAPYWVTLRKAETDMINYALEQAGSIRKAAKLLGVSESFLIVRVQRLECIRPELPTAQPKKTAAEPKKPKKKKGAAKKPKNNPEPDPPNNVVPLNPGKNGNGAA